MPSAAGGFAVGYRLPDARFEITEEKIRRYSRYALGRDVANIHTDDEKARLAGLPRRVAHGRHPVGFISEAMLGAFGEAWLRSGQMDINFTKLIFPGDTLTLRGQVVSASREGEGERITLEVALLNQHGEPVQSGQTSVWLCTSGAEAR